MANMMKKLLKKAEGEPPRSANPLKAPKNQSSPPQVEPSINRAPTQPDAGSNAAKSDRPEQSPSAQSPQRPPAASADKTTIEATPDRPAATADPEPKTGFSEAGAAPEQAAASSVLGQGLVVEGELHASENLTILGDVSGVIHHESDLLTVGSTGVVSAQIHAHSLVVEGRVEGDIHCSVSVKVTESATVVGNIKTARLSIADGAKFSGKIDMT